MTLSKEYRHQADVLLLFKQHKLVPVLGVTGTCITCIRLSLKRKTTGSQTSDFEPASPNAVTITTTSPFTTPDVSYIQNVTSRESC